MKKKLLISLSFLLHITQVNGMNHSLLSGNNPINQSIKDIQKNIEFFQCETFPQLFSENIPSEIQGSILDKAIFNTPSATLKNALKLIYTFSIVCKNFNSFINNDKLTLNLIKQLAHIFDQSNEYIAKNLNTITASKRFMLQKGFELICGNNRYARISQTDALHIKKNNIDIDFTYGNEKKTQLIIASTATVDTVAMGKPHIVKWLIKNGANINIMDVYQRSAASYAAQTYFTKTSLIEYFWDHPAFDINQKCIEMHNEIITQESTLLFMLIWSLPENNNQHQRERANKLRLITKLCNKGADPTLPTNNITPLDRAKFMNDKELIKTLQEAIDIKNMCNKN